jgi:glucose/mannose transport system substrate-binding protein
MNGGAAMDMMGSWFDTYQQSKGFKPGTDFDYFPAPSFAKITVIQPDAIMSSPSLSDDAKASADKFLALAVSPDGQVAFNHYKGGLPSSNKTPTTAFADDPVLTRMQQDFQRADQVAIPNMEVMFPAKFSQDYGAALEQFAATPGGDRAMFNDLERERQSLVATGEFANWTN